VSGFFVSEVQSHSSHGETLPVTTSPCLMAKGKK
jgi:hypothetical protein